MHIKSRIYISGTASEDIQTAEWANGHRSFKNQATFTPPIFHMRATKTACNLFLNAISSLSDLTRTKNSGGYCLWLVVALRSTDRLSLPSLFYTPRRTPFFFSFCLLSFAIFFFFILFFFYFSGTATTITWRIVPGLWKGNHNFTLMQPLQTVNCTTVIYSFLLQMNRVFNSILIIVRKTWEQWFSVVLGGAR